MGDFITQGCRSPAQGGLEIVFVKEIRATMVSF